jgi:hypothetical protein
MTVLLCSNCAPETYVSEGCAQRLDRSRGSAHDGHCLVINQPPVTCFRFAYDGESSDKVKRPLPVRALRSSVMGTSAAARTPLRPASSRKIVRSALPVSVLTTGFDTSRSARGNQTNHPDALLLDALLLVVSSCIPRLRFRFRTRRSPHGVVTAASGQSRCPPMETPPPDELSVAMDSSRALLALASHRNSIIAHSNTPPHGKSLETRWTRFGLMRFRRRGTDALVRALLFSVGIT